MTTSLPLPDEPQFGRDRDGRVVQFWVDDTGHVMAKPCRTFEHPSTGDTYRPRRELAPVETRWGVLVTCASETTCGPERVTCVSASREEVQAHVDAINRHNPLNGIRAVLARSFDGEPFHVTHCPTLTVHEFMDRYRATGTGF